jgi:uncharacterized protein (DUF4415 family)
MTSKRVPLTDASGDVRELTSSDLRRFKPAAQVLSPTLYKGLLDLNAQARRGRQKAPTKLPTTIRLSPDVMAAFKATGAGWQTRIDNALKDWLKTHSPV